MLEDWKTIANAGYISKSSSLPQELRMQSAETFLQEVMDAFVQSCVKFYKVVGIFPFIYHERQVQSVLSPAIDKVADAVVVEFPVKRGSKKYLGRLDYVVFYHEFIFLVELKHAWISATLPEVQMKGMQRAWQIAWQQVHSISENVVRGYGYNPYKVLKMGMLVAPCFQALEDEVTLKPFDQTKVTEIHQILIEGLNPLPNLSCVWMLDRRLQVVQEYVDKKEMYPCVVFMTKVETF